MAHGQLLYSFYGDDFTGSTDVLQQLASRGVSAVLFLRPPTEEDLRRFPGVRAVGIAGDSRSRSPSWMDEHLPGIFARLRTLGAPVVHYKVCSTFDSSPVTGSIGRALEHGLRAFPETPFVPVVVAAPHLQRYVVFGNLFASAPDGQVLRIDRHPMSRHPITPMREADLRRHLAQQTTLPISLWDLRLLETDGPWQMPGQGSVVLFDGVDERMQARTGDILWQAAQSSTLFSVSSSGLTSALVHAWQTKGLQLGDAGPVLPIAQRAPLLVISGSCSAMTASQINYAFGAGFTGLAVDPEDLLGDPFRSDALTVSISDFLLRGQSLVVYTAVGTPETGSLYGSTLGVQLGRVLRSVLEQTKVRRVVLCGGDTCSHAVQQLDLLALTWMADAAPGTPLCRGHSEAAEVDGLELVLKGGQVGGEDLFLRVLHADRL